MPALSRRNLLAVAVGTALARPALAFPDRLIRVICPWNPGGVADVLTRAIAQAITARAGQSVVVDNRAGAAGGVGAEAASRAPADGYTLFVSNADTHAINPFIYRRLAYDPERSFRPVSLFARTPFALMVSGARREIRDFSALVAAAKAAPGTLTFASWGIGSVPHLGMERIARAVGFEMLHVPFTGQAPGMQAVAGGHVDAMLLPAGGAEALARDGSVRVLAAASEERLAILPEVPTLRELGVDLVTGNWFAFHVPARTPDAAVQRLAQLTAEAVRDPRVIEVFRAQATTPVATTPDELGQFVSAERERWGAVIRAVGVQVE